MSGKLFKGFLIQHFTLLMLSSGGMFPTHISRWALEAFSFGRSFGITTLNS